MSNNLTLDFKPNEVYDAAIERWGVKSQVNMALEELAECSLAINKLFNRDWSMNRLIDLASEVADVTIMMEQIERVLKFAKERGELPVGCADLDFELMVADQYIYKINRLAQRAGMTEQL